MIKVHFDDAKITIIFNIATKKMLFLQKKLTL